MDKRLSTKQQLFVAEYLVDLNATQAAIRAGYSPRTAAEAGYENLRKPQVELAIEQAMTERERRTAVTSDAVVRELARIAFANILDFVSVSEAGLTIKKGCQLDGHALAEITEAPSAFGMRRSVKLHDKLKALELLGRHLGMFRDKVEVSRPTNLADCLAKARQRHLRQQHCATSTRGEEAGNLATI